MHDENKIQISPPRISCEHNNESNAITVESDDTDGHSSEGAKEMNDTGDLEKGVSVAQITKAKEYGGLHLVFSKSKKMMICFIISFAGLVAFFSSTIYYPSLTQISKDFNVSVSQINLTVTTFIIFQAVSPSLVCPISDIVGRRPVLISSLTLFIVICVGLALVPSYPALLGLRMIQSFAASPAVALGGGVITDITAPAERGGYIGIYLACQTISMAIGPMVGGIVANQLSWRWTFWVLLIMGAFGLILVFCFVPETARNLVGNGNGLANATPLQWIKQSIAYKSKSSEPDNTTAPNVHKMPNFIEPYLILCYSDVFVSMVINGGFTYLLYSFNITTPVYFSSIYKLNELQVGLCYLPLGIGSLIGAYTSGRLLDKEFRTVATNQGVTPEEIKKSAKVALDFPIYRVRLRPCWFVIIIEVLVAIAYGWTLQVETHIAVPIILQFLGGLCSVPIFNTIQTLLTDLFPLKGATTVASSNIIRCIFGAIASSTIQPGINSIGLGWMFTLIGLILTAIAGLVPVLIKYGPIWRMKRSEKQPTLQSDYLVADGCNAKPSVTGTR